VHDAVLVGFLERLGNLAGNRQRVLERDPPAGQPLLQRFALDQLQHQERLTVGLLQPVDRGDVRVVERGEELGLAPEPGETLRIARHLGGKHLEGDVAAELRVLRAVDLAHPPRAERGHDLVVPETLARRVGQRSRSTRGSRRHRSTRPETETYGGLSRRPCLAAMIQTI
jgi:hypothetical protein